MIKTYSQFAYEVFILLSEASTTKIVDGLPILFSVVVALRECECE
jgi:hypothetical protein